MTYWLFIGAITLFFTFPIVGGLIYSIFDDGSRIKDWDRPMIEEQDLPGVHKTGEYR